MSTSGGSGIPDLAGDLAAAGFQVLSQWDCTNLLQAVIKEAPDLIVLYEQSPESGLFGSIAAISATVPRPVVVFTADLDAEKIALATRSGVHAYVVNGYGPNRLRPVIHLAQARFRHERLIQAELAEVNQRFAERKLVDRAKGILMGARQLREEEAYRALRSAAMHSKQRIGQVAQRVIDSAHYAEAVNRAGQLRMLSQRLAKLYALACAGVASGEVEGLLGESVAHIEANLASLSRSVSKATFGDLLDAVLATWRGLQAILPGAPATARLGEVDRGADEMMRRAEQLTSNLEIAGNLPGLHVINVAGRQRMLSQRMAKEALMAILLDGRPAAQAAAALEAARTEFLDGLAYLRTLPLSNAAIDGELDGAVQGWEEFGAALPQIGTAAGKGDVLQASEFLLARFERVTDGLERGLQGLL